MDVNKLERLSNITHIDIAESSGTASSGKGYRCYWTWETIQHYT
jgi:hypothetical protein